MNINTNNDEIPVEKKRWMECTSWTIARFQFWPIIIFATSGAHGTHALPKPKWFHTDRGRSGWRIRWIKGVFRGGNEFLRLSPGKVGEEVVELYTGILSSWRKSIRFPPFQVRRGGRRGIDGGRGGDIRVTRSGSITDTPWNIDTRIPINSPLMNGNGINKWLHAFSIRFSLRNFRFGGNITSLKRKY